jgi:starch synthase
LLPSILFATPECVPLVKTGGLGDVSAALPQALRALGADARVLLPGYRAVLSHDPAAREIASFTASGVGVRLLESQLPNDAPPLFTRGGGPYQDDMGDDWSDNALRFGVLSQVAAILGGPESPLAWRPDVVHCNDWPTALAPLYLYFTPKPRAASLITIHNLAFQGVFPYEDITALGLPRESLGIDGVEFYGQASFLKAALIFADAINTVSPTYAQEIQTPELGFGLDGVLRMRANRLSGVLNGIDVSLWNPATDPWIPAQYDAASVEKKRASKEKLQQRFELKGGDDVPLFATVARLTHQKGIDVIAEAMRAIVALPANVIVVGAGDRDLAQRMRDLRNALPGSVGTYIGFDESLAHLVEAGADIFLMPSRFEPCGMNQMYSQRYGTPPIAHATGGLVDTIDATTGFLFEPATSPALIEAARRAAALFRDKKKWRQMQLKGMGRDFSWEPAAGEYLKLYEKLVSGTHFQK